MKKIIITIGFIALVLYFGIKVKRKYDEIITQYDSAQNYHKELPAKGQLQNGDIIFQTSKSAQSKAVQVATKSQYSHCGIIIKEENDFYVFEAVQPVKKTPLLKWVARGENRHYVVKRLKNANVVLTKTNLDRMKHVGQSFIGKNYDLTFEWSDEKIYCSELVWKIYKRATGVDVGKLETLKDFELNSELVKQKMYERYGNEIPLNDTVISPVAIFNSNQLVLVTSN